MIAAISLSICDEWARVEAAHQRLALPAQVSFIASVAGYRAHQVDAPGIDRAAIEAETAVLAERFFARTLR